MKWITFATADHLNDYGYKGDARYSIDWSTNADEKYKQPITGVRVYESGRIEIRRNAYRDPAWNHRLIELLGVQFLNPKTDFPGAKLFTADGRRVRKNELGDNTHHLYTPKFGRLYSVNWNGLITFLSPDAQPVARKPIQLRVRNTTREQEYLAELQPAIALGRTLNALGAHNNTGSCATVDQYILSRAVPRDLESPAMHRVCSALDMYATHRDALIRTVCCDTITTPYITVKLPQGGAVNSQIAWACQDSVSVKSLVVS